jgi:sugar phosphate isomerase/epimerase
MKFSLSTASLFPRGPESIFSLAKGAGFDGIELALTPDLVGRKASFWRHISDAHDMPILSIHAPYFDRRLRIPGRERDEETLELAVALNCPVVTFHVYWRFATGERGRRRFDQLRAYQLRYGERTTIAIENGARPHRPGEALAALDYVSTMQSYVEEGDFAVTFDTSHAAAHEGGLPATFDALNSRFANVHFSDLKKRWVPPGLSRIPLLEMHYRSHFVEHQMPGTGSLPLGDVLNWLHRDGYAGPITFEISPVVLGVWRLGNAQEKLGNSLESFRRHLRAVETGLTSEKG